MPRILLIDDHPLFRQALSAVLSWAQPGFLVEETDTLERARALLKESRDTELVLLDLTLPDCAGFAGLLILRNNFPTLPIIIISATSDMNAANRAIAFGAAGFVSKSATHKEIASAIKCVMSGDVWAPAATSEITSPVISSIASLTPTQLRILQGLQKGALNKQIASDMKIALATVKVHMGDMFRKLGVRNRTQAALAAQALNLSDDADIHAA